MKLKDFIQQVQEIAAHDLKGGDMEVILFDRTEGRELRVDIDADVADFEIMRGDGEIVIEFN